MAEEVDVWLVVAVAVAVDDGVDVDGEAEPEEALVGAIAGEVNPKGPIPIPAPEGNSNPPNPPKFANGLIKGALEVDVVDAVAPLEVDPDEAVEEADADPEAPADCTPGKGKLLPVGPSCEAAISRNSGFDII